MLGAKMFNMLTEKYEEELRLLRKLIIEYWKDTEDAKDGTIDVDMSYEEWIEEYIGELVHFHDEEYIKKDIAESIITYLSYLF